MIATKGADQVRSEIDKLPDDTAYELKSDTWLVAFDGTTRKLAERLGIRGGENGSGLVLAVEGYSGRASSDVWDWFKSQLRKAGDA